MKQVIINKSGNVGKSELARHLHTQKIVSVEMLNANDHKVKGIRGGSDEIMINTLTEEHLTIDVGASEYERFITMLTENPGTVDDIDRWIIPVTPSHKQQRDSMDTIGDLLGLGVSANNIRIIFNKVTAETFSTDFAGITASLGELEIPFDPSAAIPETDVFLKLSMAEKTMEQILTDATDYKASILKEKKPDEKRNLAMKLALQRAVNGLSKHIGQVRQHVTH